ncbi:MAG: sugar phosphate isomerase/epimerase, partial [Chitinophagales bacterium]
MHNRRAFLKNSGAFALGSFMISNKPLAAFNIKQSHAVGLQLFTLFTSLDKDVSGILKQVAAIGYTEIESAFSMKGGFYGFKPKEFASFANDAGLKWVSHH